ncbi:hypothetical protein Tco_0756831 [Tanacetum coccineum]
MNIAGIGLYTTSDGILNEATPVSEVIKGMTTSMVNVDVAGNALWKPPKCASCKVFRHIHEECLKNTCAGEKKTANKPSQTSRGCLNELLTSGQAYSCGLLLNPLKEVIRGHSHSDEYED